MQTKTQQIFQLTAPYNNPYQGKEPRLLFVCSVGLLRSPTCADIATKLGFNARSCGSDSAALIPLSTNLLYWADTIIFVNTENKLQALFTFQDQEGCISIIHHKGIVMGIQDDYERNDSELISKVTPVIVQLNDAYKDWL